MDPWVCSGPLRLNAGVRQKNVLGIIAVKTCPACGKKLSAAAFNGSARTADGLARTWRACVRRTSSPDDMFKLAFGMEYYSLGRGERPDHQLGDLLESI